MEENKEESQKNKLLDGMADRSVDPCPWPLVLSYEPRRLLNVIEFSEPASYVEAILREWLHTSFGGECSLSFC